MPHQYKKVSLIAISSFLILTVFSLLKVFPSFKLKADEDTTPPEIVAYGFDLETVNTEEEAQTITLYVRVSDDISGVSGVYISAEPLQHPGHIVNAEVTPMFEIDEEICDSLPLSLPEGFTTGLEGCGDNMDGIYMAQFYLPRYSPKGIWKIGKLEDANVGSLTVMDNTNNQKDCIQDDSIDASFTNSATIHDITAPELLSISMSPTHFNSNVGDAEITVLMEIEDDLSGLDDAAFHIRPLIDSRTITRSSYTVVEEGAQYNEESNLIKGTIELVVTIPQGSKTGLWSVEQVDLTDQIGNMFAIAGFKNLSYTFPNLDLFLINQALSDQVLIEEDWYIEEWDDYDVGFYLTHPLMSIKFEEGTVITKNEGGSFGLHRMLTRKYNPTEYANITALITAANTQLSSNLSTCDSSEGCNNTLLNTNNLVGEPVNIIKMGIPGLNLSFSKPVIISIAVDEKYLGTTFVIQTFDITTGSWKDETTCLVQIVEPSSYEHGGGPGGFYQPGPYSACVFSVDHATFFSMNVPGTTNNAGVPNTGIGGVYNNLFKWLKQ